MKNKVIFSYQLNRFNQYVKFYTIMSKTYLIKDYNNYYIKFNLFYKEINAIFYK